MKRKWEIAMGVILLLATGIWVNQSDKAVATQAEAQKLCIVLDAGHGGDDPGKIGINGALEKDINLSITQMLKVMLEEKGVKVVLTRETEDGLYDAGADNKKVQDMRRRCEIITETEPVCTISIHQNSYPDESIHGAQCFYFGQSEEGRELAECIQAALIEQIDPKNHRQAKANESYYLLKKTPTPTVIVECGFLSNHSEAELLETEEYQKKIAQVICDSLISYYNAEESIQGSTET